MKQSNKLLKILWNIEEIILMICLAVMGISLFLQVVFRYLFNMPLIWSEELARYLHVWITFIGLGYGIRNKSHIEMKIFYQKLPVAGQKTVTILTNLFLVLCFVFYMPGVMRFVMDQNLIDSAAMGVRMSIVYIVLPIGAIVSILYLLTDTWLNVISLTGMKERENRC
ncbi:TRAP transporter small permease [Petroclostridium sp. X23]|uniref:TRAP transporter small permease n=1 Tax=Petroclostridium sp. X23 TaxID=3045146 RepID=UPI0024ADC226|nr:TRAP transporter small permease [Petroclostridium sp. X23]WHH59082.1 TRAP transporter small permease [Petroclostridium sp. X23]